LLKLSLVVGWYPFLRHSAYAVHIGATRRIRLSRPCSAAMRRYVKLLYFDHLLVLILHHAASDEVTDNIRAYLHLTTTAHTHVHVLCVTLCTVITTFDRNSQGRNDQFGSYRRTACLRASCAVVNGQNLPRLKT